MTLLHHAAVIRVLGPLVLTALATWSGGAAAQAPAGGGTAGAGGAGSAGGATVFRCGPGQYSSEPCPGGVKLDTPAPPTAEQQRVAREAAAREARLARQLADERKAREREAAKQAAATARAKPSASAPGATDARTDQGADRPGEPRRKDQAGPAVRTAKTRDAAAERKPAASGQKAKRRKKQASSAPQTPA